MSECVGFAERSSFTGAHGISLSIARSLMSGEPESAVYEAEGGHVALWWGPIVPVHYGDTVRYFSTRAGIAVEAVEAGGAS